VREAHNYNSALWRGGVWAAECSATPRAALRNKGIAIVKNKLEAERIWQRTRFDAALRTGALNFGRAQIALDRCARPAASCLHKSYSGRTRTGMSQPVGELNSR
jgi:hypothetical protein